MHDYSQAHAYTLGTTQTGFVFLCIRAVCHVLSPILYKMFAIEFKKRLILDSYIRER